MYLVVGNSEWECEGGVLSPGIEEEDEKEQEKCVNKRGSGRWLCSLNSGVE